MDYLRHPYSQDDQPSYRHHYGDGGYQQPLPPLSDQSPYGSAPQPVGYGGYGVDDGSYGRPRSYGGAFDHDQYDQTPPPPRGYQSSNMPYDDYQNYPPPPRQNSYVGDEENNPHLKPQHIPGFLEGQFNHNKQPSYYNNNNVNSNNNYVSEGVALVENRLGLLKHKPSYKVYSKAGGERFAVAIRDGKVVLAHLNPTDPTQNWCKEEKYSTKVKDEERNPSFMLVNKSTGQAIKHSVTGQPVQLVPYKPDVFDVSLMWTESRDMGSGFRTIRTVNNTSLVMDAWNGDKNHGGVRDGTVVALFKSWKGDNQNQQWKFFPN